MGASVAYHLAARGARDILVIDRADAPGRRQHQPRHRRLPRAVRHRDQRPAVAAVAPEAAALPRGNRRRVRLRAVRVSVARDRASARWGFSTRRARCSTRRACTKAVEVSVEDIARINPAVDLEGIAGGAFWPRTASSTRRAFSRATCPRRRGLGVRIEWGVEATWAGPRRRRVGSPRSADGDRDDPRRHRRQRRGRVGRRLRVLVRRRRAGDAAPAPGRAHRAHEGAALVDADDHLLRRRLSTCACATGACCCCGRRPACPTVRSTTRSIRRGWSR